MRYQAFVRAAAVVLSASFLSSGVALAQRSVTEPRPAGPGETVTDAAPLPAHERGSVGAVVLMDQPVLAQEAAMQQARAREPDTRSMGAAARVLQQTLAREQLEQQRALDAAGERGGGGPGQ